MCFFWIGDVDFALIRQQEQERASFNRWLFPSNAGIWMPFGIWDQFSMSLPIPIFFNRVHVGFEGGGSRNNLLWDSYCACLLQGKWSCSTLFMKCKRKCATWLSVPLSGDQMLQGAICNGVLKPTCWTLVYFMQRIAAVLIFWQDTYPKNFLSWAMSRKIWWIFMTISLQQNIGFQLKSQ